MADPIIKIPSKDKIIESYQTGTGFGNGGISVELTNNLFSGVALILFSAFVITALYRTFRAGEKTGNSEMSLEIFLIVLLFVFFTIVVSSFSYTGNF